MKVSIGSDLHIEFGPFDIRNHDKADVLILSGDIMVAKNPDSKFLEQCSSEFEHTVYVAGNHEYYGGKWYQTTQRLKELCENYRGVHFLENDRVMIHDHLFIGAALWTDMNKNDPITIMEVEQSMNDFRRITYEGDHYRKLRAKDVIERHQKTKQYFQWEMDNNDPYQRMVVVGHHAPTPQSIHEYYRNSTHMNGAYASDLSEFILDNPRIKLWTHGHTHCPFDYMVGETRVVCNPRGYIGYEDQAFGFQLKTIEV